MKIKEHTPTRLVLAGVPGGQGWMVVLVLVGAALTAAAIWFGTHEWRQGNWYNLIWIALGVLVAQGLFWTGLITLLVGRERLELDLVTGEGRYDVRSPIVETERPFTFDLAKVHSVALERTHESRPGGPDTMETTADVVRARLRTVKPRRAVLLDETENGRDERVRATASAVAAFLGLELTERPPG